MLELLWLLLPVAAASGWWAARRGRVEQHSVRTGSAEYFKGLNYLLDDKPDQAIEVFTRMAEVNRDTAETHLTLGNLFRRRGEVDRAISIHSSLITRSTLTLQQRNRAVLELGEDYMRAGLLDRAETLFREVVEQADYTTVALARLVDIYEQEKDWDQAMAYCDRLEQMRGHCMKAKTAHFCCELAEEAWHRNDKKKAQDYLLQALTRDPDCARANIVRGRIALSEKDYCSAIAAFKAVEQQNPSYFSEVIQYLDQCYSALGTKTKLIDDLRDVHKRNHTGLITDALAELLVQEEGENSAIQFLEAELQNYPTLLGMRRLVELKLTQTQSKDHSDLDALYRISRQMLNGSARYRCDHCGFVGRFLHWCCPSCKNWGSIKPIPDLMLRHHA